MESVADSAGLICGGSPSEKSSYCVGGIGEVRGVGVRVNTYWQRAPLYVAEETGALVPTKNPVPTLFVPTDMRPRLWAVAGDQAAV